MKRPSRAKASPAQTNDAAVEPILPVKIPHTAARLARGVRAGRWVFATGQAATDYVNGLAPDVEQAARPLNGESQYKRESRHIYRNVKEVLAKAKADFTDTVIDNAFEGGYMAGRYLVERGHREIGVIPGLMERNTGAGRLAGFMKAMDEALIKVPENWIVQGDFEPESGYRAMQQILSQAHRPTAVFCGGDIMAMGALCAADEMGLRVPQDVSLIGYDNVRNARFFTPALTTIHQPKDSLGETAFNMLLDRIVNKREESQSIEVHPRLVERRSVADGPFRDYRR